MLKHLIIAAMANGVLPCPKPTECTPDCSTPSETAVVEAPLEPCAKPCVEPCVEPVTAPFPDGLTLPTGESALSESERTIELAICLDTSGSMQGLINSAREKLWTIVNDLAMAQPAPRLRLALLSYGNDGLSPENGWVKVEVPFTEDIDLLSDRLFALSTNGGTELVGRVVHSAAHTLDWSPSDETLKLIFVAGNESADQDQTISYVDACSTSIARGIQVNAIYCGPATDNIAPGWKNVSTLADGHFASIDQNKQPVAIVTPFDDDMNKYSLEFNGTTLPFGQKGTWGASNIARQDSNAMGCNGASAASRAFTKCQSFYNNDSWDLVDALRNGKLKLEEVKKEELPEAVKDKTTEEIRAHVDELYAKRKKIQAEILALQTKRDAFIAAERKKNAIDATDHFDAAVRTAIRAQAEAKGFAFPATPTVVVVEEAAPIAEDQ